MARLINYEGLTADLAANAERINLATQDPQPLRAASLKGAYDEKFALLAPRKDEIKRDLLKLTGHNYKLNEQGKFSLFVVKTSYSSWNVRAEDIRTMSHAREITDNDVVEQSKALEKSGLQGEDIILNGKREFVIDPAQTDFFKKLKTALGKVDDTQPLSASERRRKAKEAGNHGSER